MIEPEEAENLLKKIRLAQLEVINRYRLMKGNKSKLFKDDGYYDDCNEDPNNKGKGRLQFFCLVWNWNKFVENLMNWTEDDFVKTGHEWLISALRERGDVEDFFFQLEKGDKNGRYHYQIYVKTKRRFQGLTYRNLICDVIPGIWVSIASTDGKNQLRDYCMKTTDSTYVRGPWAINENRIKELIEEKEKEMEKKNFDPLKFCKIDEKNPESLRSFQKDLLNLYKNRTILEEKIASGDIYLVVGIFGLEGKNQFCRYLAAKYKVPFFTQAEAKNMKQTAIKDIYDLGMVVNISRTISKFTLIDELLDGIEQIKDGHFCIEKYDAPRILGYPKFCTIFWNYPLPPNAFSGRLKYFTLDKLNLLDPITGETKIDFALKEHKTYDSLFYECVKYKQDDPYLSRLAKFYGYTKKMQTWKDMINENIEFDEQQPNIKTINKEIRKTRRRFVVQEDETDLEN